MSSPGIKKRIRDVVDDHISPGPKRLQHGSGQSGTASSTDCMPVTKTMEELNAPTTSLIYSEIPEDSIRVVHLLPGEPLDPIRFLLSTQKLGRLVPVPINEYLKLAIYEALSYVWGSKDNPVETSVEGHPFWVTRNLAEALVTLRSPMLSRTLWIDALCINQNNIPERNAQVRRMFEIYRKAERVLIWLGPSNIASESSIAFIQEFDYNKEFDLRKTEHRNLLSILREICLREYWGRVWICQEIQASRPFTTMVMYGSYLIPWRSLALLVRELLSNTPWQDRWRTRLLSSLGSETELETRLILKSTGPSSVMKPTRMRLAREAPKKLFQINVIITQKQCVDPRDKIFGIYHLLLEEVKRNIIIDYSRSTRTVFINATFSYIRFGSCLSLISWPVKNHDQGALRLPSWVPDWVPDWASELKITPYASEIDDRTFANHISDDAAFCAFEPENVLHVKGYCVGNVNKMEVSPHLQSPAPSTITESDLRLLWLHMIQCLLLICSFGEGNNPEIDFFKTMAVESDSYPPVGRKFWELVYSSIRGYREQGESILLADEFQLSQDVRLLLLRFRRLQAYRKFFTFRHIADRLSKSPLGWGMANTSVKIGDLVCVIPNCVVPVVLRPTAYGRHIIVSDACTHERLTTNVLRRMQDGSLALQDFYIE